ncbi:inositol monophosphatase family protein [Mesoterricola sediminis]|uniref:Inositol-1-monophosphatase n=1 Tax=Mesoterricola sediminis TaxID=2927980 RepID=A0AA48KEZ1_9BACT|nr:inositol monophosphatase family protein [Mesoterricola sediminis]BDU77782.1 inositol monophosphatase [Mesoterricola sediminis]
MFETEREACIQAAKAGGAVLKGLWGRLDPSTITEKTKNDYVTEADRRSEATIHRELDRLIPGLAFLGEETGAQGPQGGRRWIVDPLDGTLNFVQGFPHWCVSVALWDEAGPLAGCVYDPLREDVFAAARGAGATCNGRPLAVSAQAGLDGAFLATGFAFQLGDRFPRFQRALEPVFYRAKAIRRAGSAALDLAHTAAGIYDGFFEMGLKRWDFGAGVLLVQEAGGTLSDWEGGDTWRETGDMVAAAPAVHPELVAAIRTRP